MTHAKILLAAVLVLPRLLLACEATPEASSPFDGLCGVVSGQCSRRPLIAVLSAFPYEQHALRAATEVTETLDFLGRSLLIGRLGGQRVLLRLTGIGLVNATQTTDALLAQFDLAAIVFSGVAGSIHRIGDVTVPATWTDFQSGRSFGVDPGFLAAGERVAASPPTLGHCTPNPPEPPGPELCLPYAPTVLVGGRGSSSDPFGGTTFPCQPNPTGAFADVFGCEAQRIAIPQGEDTTADAVDMETAAVAEVAAAHAVPFIGVRAASDGAGDPLGLPPESFQQFFIYYRLAADNAAAVTIKLLSELPGAGKVRRHPRTRHGRPAATCDFERAAAPECEGVSASRRIARLVSGACALRAKAVAGNPRADQLAGRAAERWRRAAMLVEHGKLPSCCAEGLARRLRVAADTVATDVHIRLPW